MLGSQRMTFLSDEAKTQSHSTYPGMAFFAGTGPLDKTCGDCKFKGYRRESSKTRWDHMSGQQIIKTYRVSGCEKFKMLAGLHGKPIPPEARSCKYFEAKAK